MITKIILFSVKNKFLILVFSILLAIISFYSMKNMQLDAIPDLSDTQVIILSRWDQSPDIIEDQVTYPIITSLLGAPKVKVIRGFSDFGYSFVYVLFEDGTDIYWARSRITEYMSRIQGLLPEGVKTEIGPDATGVGWVFQYALIDKSNKLNPQELRSIQDFKIRYILNSVQGVSEVASVGGFKKQYQIQIDPQALINYDISLKDVIDKVKQSNRESGARLMEIGGAEFMIRGRGYANSIEDLKNISLKVNKDGIPILLSNIASINLGPDIRRGFSDYNGMGDTVGGIIVMRQGENALNVIEKVKEKIAKIQKTLPEGVEIVTVYDRSELIENSIENLKDKLIEEIVIVSIVIMFFLWHFPSALIPILTIPVSILIAFIPLYFFHIGSNIMSLSGIAISIGVLVDGAIVEVENAYKKLEEWQAGGRIGDYHTIRMEALLEVGPSVFFSLLIISVSFLPIFTLVDQEGRLFKPLAFSKNLTMAIAAILAITLDPAVRMLFTRMEPFTFSKFPKLNSFATTLFVGKYYKEENHPISKRLFKIYEPICRFTLKHSKGTIVGSLILILLTIPVYLNLGSEFMPPLYEESYLYMPTTMPGISIAEASSLLQKMDEKIINFPEVVSVFGKAGRAETSTDPAPMAMFENVILLKPRSEWRKKERFYSNFPEFTKPLFRFFVTDRYSPDELKDLFDKEMQFPGVSNAWTMPIKARIDMLSTGVRTPIGIKVQGENLETIEKIAVEIEEKLKNIKGTGSVFAERTAGGYYLDIKIKRNNIARYGITVGTVQDIITSAIGGEPISQTIEGRERYSINIRYPRELRDSRDKLGRILVPTALNSHIPLKDLAEIKYVAGPSMIRDENGFLTGYVYVTLHPDEKDLGGYVERAKEYIENNVKTPTGYTVFWSGQYENILRVKERLKLIIPITLVLIFILLYLNTKSYFKTFLVLLAVPFSLIGAICFLYILDYQISIAVWVGMIALMGLDAETGVFMLLYLDLSLNEARKYNLLNN
ncbi:MAG: efflux RND transporter permease subunit, partial [Leptospiraceae bacterium]|nr:efflux RND transporter permease subunit [Leptospiraceae bacterium]